MTSVAATERVESVLATLVTHPDEAERAVCAALGGPLRCMIAHRGLDTWSSRGNFDTSALFPADDTGSSPHTVIAADYAVVLVDRDLAPDDSVLERACTWLTLTRRMSEARAEVRDFHYESTVVGELAKQVLSVGDLDQVLLTITDETLRMSESDICGVFLREGDQLHMKSCTGHRLVETARLRMSRGQGVAGMVFDTLRPARIDSYLQDETISTDFMSLAEQEETRSALAVPLMLGDDLVGVLEVWRRRYSSFTERDVRRLQSLADLATIAIDNARLYDSQRTALRQLEITHTKLESQIGLLHENAELQRTLIDIVLDNGAVFNQVTRTLSKYLQAPVAVMSADGSVDAVFPRDTDPLAFEIAVTAQQESLQRGTSWRMTTARGDELSVYPVKLGEDQFGAVCALGPPSDNDRAELACTHAALACALFHLQQRAASLARAEALDQILWDLMDGSSEQRSAARGRAQQMGVWLRGWHRVLYGAIDDLDSHAQQEHWSPSAADRTRRRVLDAVRGIASPAQPTLASARGNWIIALVPIRDRDRSREFLRTLKSQVETDIPEVSVSWGLSTAREQPSHYPEAFAEARTALAAARRLGSVSIYEDLGIVRLLLGHDDEDFRSFVREITGPLQEYDRTNDGSLMKTLRAYFDSNCSQKDAANLLYIHHKTLAYRLDRIRKLTGLDLAQHADRMRADLALRLLEVSEQADHPRQ